MGRIAFRTFGVCGVDETKTIAAEENVHLATYVLSGEAAKGRQSPCGLSTPNQSHFGMAVKGTAVLF